MLIDPGTGMIMATLARQVDTNFAQTSARMLALTEGDLALTPMSHIKVLEMPFFQAFAEQMAASLY